MKYLIKNIEELRTLIREYAVTGYEVGFIPKHSKFIVSVNHFSTDQFPLILVFIGISGIQNTAIFEPVFISDFELSAIEAGVKQLEQINRDNDELNLRSRIVYSHERGEYEHVVVGEIDIPDINNK